MIEDVVVVHASARKGFEADDNVDDFVRIDPNSVLAAELVRIELVGMP